MLPTHATFFLADETATLAFAQRFAQALAPGDTVWLNGDLGAGKTTFVRGMLRALGVTGRIKSPTFALVETYTIALPLVHSATESTQKPLNFHHFDFYRCTDGSEWRDAGFAEYFEPPASEPPSICAVEWAQRQVGLPSPAWEVSLSPERGGRALDLQARTERAQQWLQKNLSLLQSTPPAAP
jgi:tRNA threonylcarbamoyladenosine biosynthesis protein TsaE